jgi:hypothetical protein
MGAGKPEVVAQQIDQQRAVFDFARVPGAVNGDFDFGHKMGFVTRDS